MAKIIIRQKRQKNDMKLLSMNQNSVKPIFNQLHQFGETNFQNVLTRIRKLCFLDYIEVLRFIHKNWSSNGTITSSKLGQICKCWLLRFFLDHNLKINNKKKKRFQGNTKKGDNQPFDVSYCRYWITSSNRKKKTLL